MYILCLNGDPLIRDIDSDVVHSQSFWGFTSSYPNSLCFRLCLKPMTYAYTWNFFFFNETKNYNQQRNRGPPNGYMHGDRRWTNHGLPRHRGTLPHHIRTLKQKPQSVKRVGCVCVSQVWSIGNSICFRLGPKLLKCPLNESKSKLNFYDGPT